MDKARYMRDIYSVTEEVCEKFSGNVLFYSSGNKITYSETLPLVKQRGAFLLKNGFGKGDIIGILSVNSPEWCITFLAITSIGAVALPMDISFQGEQYESMIRGAGAKALFVSGEFDGMVSSVPCFNIGRGESMEDEKLFIHPDISCDDTGAMLFTSGTTGNPKIVRLSHKNILHIACVCTDLEEYTPRDVTLAMLPLFHVYAFESTFMAPLVTGSSMVQQNSLKGPDIMKTLADFPVTIFPAAPVMWELFFNGIANKARAVSMFKYRMFMFFVKNAPLLRAMGLGFVLKKVFAPVHDLFGSSHRFFISGGAPLKKEYFRYYRNMGFNIIEGYGLSETTGPIAIPYYKKSVPGSVGSPIEGNSVEIRNANEEGIGEIWFKGDAVTPGYYRNDEANRAAFDENGCFNTGDLGRLDRRGNIHVTGRVKNVIVLDSGKKVYPEEIELYFKQSQAIAEIAVFDRVINGRTSVFAVIVPSVKSTESYGIIHSEVAALNRNLPDYRRVRTFAISFDELPKNSTRKILYREVRSLLDQGVYQVNENERPQLRDLFRPSGIREEEALSLLLDYFRVKELMANQPLSDFNIDSLGLIELIVYLEQRMDIAIDHGEFRKKQSISEIITYVASIEKSSGRSLEEWILRGGFETRPKLFFNPAHHLAIALLGGLSRFFWRVEAVNAENLVPENRIIVCNHQSYLDMVWISFFIPGKYRKNVYVTAKKKLSFLRFIFPVFPVIFVDDTNNIEVLKASADLLRQGKTLVIFPEGTRTPDGVMQHFKSGAAFLAKNLDVKIIPLSVKGAYDIWPRHRRLPRLFTDCRGKIYVGDEINPGDYSSVESLNLALEAAVGSLAG